MLVVSEYTPTRCLDLLEDETMPRSASITGPHKPPGGRGYYNVYDASEELVAQIYVGREKQSPYAVDEARERALAFVAVLDGEE